MRNCLRSMTIKKFISYVLYYPLLRKYKMSSVITQKFIQQDAAKYLKVNSAVINDPELIWLIKCLKSEYFRVIFYHRVGKNKGWLRNYKRQSNSLMISSKCLIRGGVHFYHPYCSIINAKKIGENFTFRHLTTIGNKIDGRNDLVPSIGNNVTLGANVTIIGDITIGDNVIVGAGSVVTKDVPSNCIVAGNPAKVIKTL